MLDQFARNPDARTSADQLDLPFLSVLVHLSPAERASAQALLIKLKDRRVLSQHECCDGCINDALRSLQEIRSMLVAEQIELAGVSEGGLYLLLELMLAAIRQFLTFEQTLGRPLKAEGNPFAQRHPDDRQRYFDALELLRGHLSRCLGQVAIVAALKIPSDGFVDGYRGPWPLEAYKAPAAGHLERLSPK
ncbi:MAG: hypothetical protein AB1942_03270 [Pseudomonadota bacterium]